MKRLYFSILLGGILFVPFISTPAADSSSNRTVRVAALQCYSHMGDTNYNRALLTRLIGQAATNGAQIVVTPECALTGYMNPGRGVTWTTNATPDENELSIRNAAEEVPGAATAHFGALARKHGIYICLGLAERATNEFFNSQVLLDPRGRMVAHHRKRNLWPPGDAGWVSRGNLPVQTVDTPHGRLGLMICFDYHVMVQALAREKTDIVLWSVGWYGPNSEDWFKNRFPRDWVKPNAFSVIAANWSMEPGASGWPGIGQSCMIGPGGQVLGAAKGARGSEVVLADLPLGPDQ